MPGPFLKTVGIIEDPIPTAGRMLWLDTKTSDSWSDSASGVEATALDPSYMPALVGDAYEFDGVNDQLVMPTNDYNTISFGHIFVVCKTNDRTKRQSLATKWKAVPPGTAPYLPEWFEWQFGIREVTAGSDGKMQFKWRGDSSDSTVTSLTPVDNDVYFLAEIVVTRSGLLTYRQNGVNQESTQSSALNVATRNYTNDLIIGNTTDRTVRQWDGSIAFIAIYGRTLTAEERNQVYTYAERWVPSVTRA